MRFRGVRQLVMVGLAAGAVACAGDAVSPTEQSDALAAALDALSRSANQSGDAGGSLAFSNAAMAVRLGVEPVPVPVQVGDRTEQYLAFVHVVRHGTGPGARELRTLIAFRPKADDDRRPVAVLYVGVAVDSARLAHPAGANPLVSATAVWKDLDHRADWIATKGKAGIVEESRGPACPRVRSSMNLDCEIGTFGAFVDGDLLQVIPGRALEVTAEPILGIRLRSGGLPGATLTFTD